jgi:ribosomal protein S18 acetylase RimI-like enzyme
MPTDISLRPVVAVDDIFAMTRALNAHEGIAVADDALRAALARLLAEPALGRAWLIADGDAAVGYAIVTLGYDLEFAGHDAWLTELWIEPARRGGGLATAALDLVAAATRALGAAALHLQVRPDNPARRLYERAGFAAVPRLLMTRRLL